MFEPETVRIVGTLGFPCGISGLSRGVLDNGLRVTQRIHNAFWMDVNTPDELEIADAAVRAGSENSGN